MIGSNDATVCNLILLGKGDSNLSVLAFSGIIHISMLLIFCFLGRIFVFNIGQNRIKLYLKSIGPTFHLEYIFFCQICLNHMFKISLQYIS